MVRKEQQRGIQMPVSFFIAVMLIVIGSILLLGGVTS
jgi:predicted nucleic acid-binding Zn ribbon protein